MEQSNISKLSELCKWSYTIDYNSHIDRYQSVEQYINELISIGSLDDEDIDNKVLQRMINDNKIVEIHYHCNSVGSYILYHYDIDLAIEELLKILK